ncbi:Putative esterase sll0410 [Planktothrix tepida]|uniref:Putative enzyme n=1 Tax=Planktothrix tepida PCC 9214 TaxID=671072 RepID=A0A1J1LL99_9CYAN|nr:thioesterase family protein [Planktothrix tepida]CAD5945791.1 Putative esterase sll0410 [Planktothrix tepida]CUR32810.1 putative enzyme [Planktothrix tepida PCC 9214]
MLRSQSICNVFETNPFPQSRLSTDTASEQPWFDYIVRVFPHHTDYGGIVWHGTYLSWLEEARVERLRLTGLEYHTLVEIGCELPVVYLNIRYHQPVKMGMEIVVKSRILPTKGVRLPWEYRIESLDGQCLYLTAQVTLVPIDRQTGKIMRCLPPVLQASLAQLLD